MGNCCSRRAEDSSGVSTKQSDSVRTSIEHSKDETVEIGEPFAGDETSTLHERDPKHIFDITFKKRPLGVHLTTDSNGKCAYVTQTNGKKNKAVDKNKLPKYSKLLKVNDINIELEEFDVILMLIVNKMKDPPLTLTFCHPDGLARDEFPDPNPPVDTLD